jgi:hypothetical protein
MELTLWASISPACRSLEWRQGGLQIPAVYRIIGKLAGCIIFPMNRRPFHELQESRLQLQAAEAELEELRKQLRSFEAQVDSRLGILLDQLSELNAETFALDEKIRKIREQRLFGADLMRYTDGAPRPSHPPNLNDLPPLGLAHRNALHSTVDRGSTTPGAQIPDIKTLYRKLARRYHPDLARSNADRTQSNEQMAEINQAYNAGDLPTLMRLAGMSIPYGVDIPQPLEPSSIHNDSLTEGERIELKLKAVRQQITQLSNLPIVKLSLEVKLARHQGRDLLREMASELQYKVARKIAERDYLEAQIQVSGEFDAD